MISLVTGFNQAAVSRLLATVPELTSEQRSFVAARPVGLQRAMRVAQIREVALHLDVDVSNVVIRSEPTGRPRVVGWPLEISVSHAGETLAIMYGNGRVGLDIETLRRREVGVIRRFFSDVEARDIIDDRSFTHGWVRKEAYAKWTGLGLGEYLAHGQYETKVGSFELGGLYIGHAGEHCDLAVTAKAAHDLLL